MKKIMTAFDLELNQPSDKIISIGAVQGDIFTGTITKELHVYVKIDELLCTDSNICDIPKLTGITDQLLEEQGVSLAEAYQMFRDFHKSSDFVNAIQWGCGDSRCLREDLARSGYYLHKGFHNPEKKELFCLGHRHFDCKQKFQEICLLESKGLQSGLKRALGRCGLGFKGKSHEAVSDARNTFLLYHHLLFKHQPGSLKSTKKDRQKNG